MQALDSMKNTKWISDELGGIIIAREKQSLFWLLGDCQVGNTGRCSQAAGQGLLGDKHTSFLWKILCLGSESQGYWPEEQDWLLSCARSLS